jgi:DNA-binding transcriptional ArsR family regulator
MSESILDRVESFMREQKESISLTEVVAAFKGEDPKVVRLTLGALRQQGILAATVDGTVPYYSVVAAPRAPQAPALRKEENRVPNPVELSEQDRVLKVMRDGSLNEYQMGEIQKLVGIGRPRLKTVMRDMLALGKVFAAGNRATRRYSFQPFGERAKATKGAPERRLMIPPDAETIELMVEAARERDVARLRPPHIAATAGSNGNGATPRFAYWSDGTLEVDCEECSGKLKRTDLEALRAFVAILPPLRD